MFGEMTSADIILHVIYYIGLVVVFWWILFRGGADYLDGTILGMLFARGIPKSSRGWNADSFKLLVVAMIAAAVAGGGILLIVHLFFRN